MQGNAQKVMTYYDKMAISCQPECIGAYPFGNGGRSEILYQHFFEFRHLKDLVTLSQNMTVLELGCGGGRWALSIAPLVRKYIAFDFSRASLESATKRAKQKKLDNIEFRYSSLQAFNPQEDYDLVYFSGVTQYVQDDELRQILSKLIPHMKPSTVIIDRSTISLKNRIVRDDKEYFSIYRTESELMDIFKSVGLESTYKNRSYRFMRFSRIINLPVVSEILPKSISISQPLSFYILYGLVFIADAIHPIVIENGDYDHKFFVFSNESK